MTRKTSPDKRPAGDSGAGAPRRAMVLAAGLGKRMRPITHRLPKPLVKVGEKALLDWTLDRLEEAGVETVVLNLHHLGHLIEQHLGRRQRRPRKGRRPELLFSSEDELLDTGGGIAKALPLLGAEPFYVVNADILWLNGTQSTLARMAAGWDHRRMDALLLLHSTVDAYGYQGRGDFCVDPAGLLARRAESEVSPFLYTGLQILHPRLFDGAPEGGFSLNLLYDRAIEAERLHGIIHDGEWFNIGTPEGLAEAEAYIRVRYAGNRRR